MSHTIEFLFPPSLPSPLGPRQVACIQATYGPIQKGFQHLLGKRPTSGLSPFSPKARSTHVLSHRDIKGPASTALCKVRAAHSRPPAILRFSLPVLVQRVLSFYFYVVFLFWWGWGVFYFVLVVLGFELRASQLPGRHSLEPCPGTF
jgi:hypothetical protein